MRIGVVSCNPEHDITSAQLLTAAQAVGDAQWVDPARLSLAVDNGNAAVLHNGRPATRFDALIVRRLSANVDLDCQVEALELLEHEGMLLINSVRSLSIAESKPQTSYLLARAGVPTPDTTVTADADETLAAIARYGRAVLKPLYGALGAAITRVDSALTRAEIEVMLDGCSPLYIQRYVPHFGHDFRAFVLGDHVLAAIRRTALPGEWCTNIAQGGSADAVSLPPETTRVAVAAARAIGLEYTGVDLIEGPDGPLVLEVNGAPAWSGLMNATGVDVPARIVEHVASRIDERRH